MAASIDLQILLRLRPYPLPQERASPLVSQPHMQVVVITPIIIIVIQSVRSEWCCWGCKIMYC